MHLARRNRAGWAILLGAARRGMKNDTIASFDDLVDLYAVKVRQQSADDLITPVIQRSIMLKIKRSSPTEAADR
jgi:hypothetical protein